MNDPIQCGECGSKAWTVRRVNRGTAIELTCRGNGCNNVRSLAPRQIIDLDPDAEVVHQ